MRKNSINSRLRALTWHSISKIFQFRTFECAEEPGLSRARESVATPSGGVMSTVAGALVSRGRPE